MKMKIKTGGIHLENVETTNPSHIFCGIVVESDQCFCK